MPQRPNPSFFAINVPRRADQARVAKAIIEEVSVESGNPLTPIGANRFVLSRPVAKKLLAIHPELLDWLSKLQGVALVRRLRATQVMALHGALDPAEETHKVLSTKTAVASIPWHYASIRVPEAWNYLEKRNPKGLDQVSVAILDTGFTEHPCFGAWSGGTNPHVRSDLGINYLESGQLPRDPIETQYPGHPGHGTRVGSVIAANNPKEFRGVAPGVTLVPYRVTNSVIIDFMGNKTPLGDALRHVLSHSGCQVVNISLGDPCFPDHDDAAAIDAAYDAGTIIVAAAGNVTSEVTYPGRYRRTITAGGVTKENSRWKPWSGGSRGPRVDFCAPSDRITRANWKYDGVWSPRYQSDGDGTSYAAAHISGVACLWLALHHDELAIYPYRWQVVEAFRRIVAKTCDKPPDWDERRFGSGIINAGAALKEPLPPRDELQYERDRAADEAS